MTSAIDLAFSGILYSIYPQARRRAAHTARHSHLT